MNKSLTPSFALIVVALGLGGCVTAPVNSGGAPVVDRSLRSPPRATPYSTPAPAPRVEVKPLSRPEPIRSQQNPEPLVPGEPVVKEPSPAMLDQARAPEQPDFNAASTSPSNGVQTSAPNPAPPTQPAGPPPRAQISRQGNPAVVALLNNASGHVDGGEWDRAAADLERALRIEPRNATIWHDLAQVRLQQRQYQLAESLASKSNSMAGENKNVRARNWRLIANARRLSGNSSGADAAEAQAVVLER